MRCIWNDCSVENRLVRCCGSVYLMTYKAGDLGLLVLLGLLVFPARSHQDEDQPHHRTNSAVRVIMSPLQQIPLLFFTVVAALFICGLLGDSVLYVWSCKWRSSVIRLI